MWINYPSKNFKTISSFFSGTRNFLMQTTGLVNQQKVTKTHGAHSSFYSGYEYNALEARGGAQLGHGKSGGKIQSNIAG